MPRWLADLGRPEPALTAIEDAVRVYRDLAQARPDAFLPDLAQAMTTLGIHLTDLANYDEALATDRHVVKLYLRLIASDLNGTPRPFRTH
jgi:hypothetical protein